MRHYLLALALAAASLAFSAAGHAGASYTEGYDQQACITKRLHTQDPHGKTVTKRVRICQ